jgi:sphingosine kinase
VRDWTVAGHRVTADGVAAALGGSGSGSKRQRREAEREAERALLRQCTGVGSMAAAPPPTVFDAFVSAMRSNCTGSGGGAAAGSALVWQGMYEREGKGRVRGLVTLQFLMPAASALGWLTALRHAIRTPPAECLSEPQWLAHWAAAGKAAAADDKAEQRQRRVRVYINPMSGRKRGREIWFGQCKPIFESAGMAVEDLVTHHAFHATEDAAALPTDTLRDYEGVVGVGGDGILAEVMQGVLQRPDWRRLLAPADGGAPLRIGLLPAGSGNGLACSLLFAVGLSYSAANSALVIAKGWQCALDVASTFVKGHQSSTGTGWVARPLAEPSSSSEAHLVAAASPAPSDGRAYQFLSTSWAIVSDLDIESERLRWMGNLRFDVYGVMRAVALRKYRGKLHFLPPGVASAAAAGSSASVSHGTATATGSSATSPSSVVMATAGGAAADGAAACGPPALHHLVPFSQPVPAHWTTIDDTFTLLWITNTTHQSIGLATAPDSSHNDGVFTVSLVRNVSAPTMVSILLSLDEAGAFQRHPAVETFECVAFRLEPEGGGKTGCCGSDGKGHISLDGEDVPYAPIQAEIHPGMLTLYGPSKQKIGEF